jgi:hypothetical protein
VSEPFPLYLRTKRPDAEVKALLGTRAVPEQYAALLRNSARVYKPNGDLLLVYLRGALSESAVARAYPFLHGLRKNVSNNRGLYGGIHGAKAKYPRIRKDGVISHTNIAPSMRSAVVGNFDRYPRIPFCRQLRLSAEDPVAWGECFPVIQEVAVLMREHAPKRYAAQLDTAQKTHPAYVIPGTPFTTLTVNNTEAGAYHTDAGDYRPGFGAMSVLRRGRYAGGTLVFPAFGVAVDMQDRDLVLFDPHEVHGNEPIVGEGPPCEPDAGGHERISVVHYFREKMTDCLSPAEELERAKHLRGDFDKLAQAAEAEATAGEVE